MASRLEQLQKQHDVWRKTTILEPRGNDILVGALLCKPQNPAATAGVIFLTIKVIWECVATALSV